jgi:hypothetical protein
MMSEPSVLSATQHQHVFEVDTGAFAAAFGRRPFPVDHTLVDHPLLTLDAIAELADRFPGRIERHRADLPVVMPGGAPELEGPPSETVRGIDHNRSWMVLWYIDQVPEYKQLLDRCLDEAESFLPAGPGSTCQREAFLFLSAPDAVTPVHFDPEYNFLLQIRGRKDMNVLPFPSAEHRQRELDRYYNGGDRNLEAMPGDGETLTLDPGKGVYVPSFMPHWVKNGPAASVSLSITFRTRDSLRAERVHRVNSRLRRVGLSPAPAGSSPRADRLKEAAWVASLKPRRGLVRLKQSLSGPRDRSHA